MSDAWNVVLDSRGSDRLTVHEEGFPESETIPWIHKRDGSVAAFDPAKLASSIFAAHGRVDPENPSFVAQELTQAVLHFLADEFSDRVLTTEDVAETVTKVLREMGHPDTATVYFHYRQSRQALRDRLRIVDSSDGELGERADPDALGVGWNKGRIAELLEQEADLDVQTSREVAAAVERRILGSQLVQLTPGLVDELIYCELMERGIDRRWSRRMPLGVPAAAIHEWLDARVDPGGVVQNVADAVLERFGQREVYSREVAGLYEEGVLRLLGGRSPVHWSLGSLRMRSTTDVAAAVYELERRWEESLRSCQHAIALDGLERIGDWPEQGTRNRSRETIARRVAGVVQRALATGQAGVVLNVASVSSDEENPLFGEEWGSGFDALGMSVAESLFRDAEDLGNSVDRLRVDFHIRPTWGKDLIASQVSSILHGFRRGFTFAFAMDRPNASPAEGLDGSGRERGVVQYIGIDVGSIVNRIGHLDQDTFVRRLLLVVDSAVRGGVQKREFLRRTSDVDHGGVVVLVPLGLAFAIERMMGQSVHDGDGSAVAFGEQLLRRIGDRARRESRHYQLTCRIDGATLDAPLEEARTVLSEGNFESLLVEVQAVGQWHAALRGGATRVVVGSDCSEELLTEFVARVAVETGTRRLILEGPRPARQGRLFDT